MNPSDRHRSGLLVSVRSVEEAEAALAGGADLIDVKEPSRGPLGRADDATIAAVMAAVGGQCPVSAALGELRDTAAPCTIDGLAYVKWGLAGMRDVRCWTEIFDAVVAAQQASNPGCGGVLVAYADWSRADAPRPESVCDHAVRCRAAAFLVDTYRKDGRTLLDWLTEAQIAHLCRRCRKHGVKFALAGSLGRNEIATLGELNPNWFAVRGAACAGGSRESRVDVERVAELKELLATAAIASQGERMTGE